MLSTFVTASALAVSVLQVVGTPVNFIARGYAQDAGILEAYNGYHTRYLALDCENQHNTQFFDDCCHPLLRWQRLSDRPAQCIPAAGPSSSAALAEPSSPYVDEDPISSYTDGATSETKANSKPTPYSPEPTTVPTAHKPETTSTPYKPETTSTPYKPDVTPYEPETTPEPTSTSYKPDVTPYKPDTTSEKPQTTQKPETTYKPDTTSAAPTTSADSSGSHSGSYTGGFATFFTQNGVAGACGTVHGDYDLIVAADYRRYGDLSQQSPLCGKKVVITNTKNGKTVTAIIADACPTCDNENCLDLSKGAFQQIATFEEGEVPITWYME